MRGSADFKLCNASGNTFSIFTYIIYIYIYRYDDNSSLFSHSRASCARCCASSVLIKC
jgi:hypothetical protein